MRKLALALTLVLSSVVPLAAQATTTIDRQNILGNSAYATWDYTQGNIGTFVSVVLTTQTGTSPDHFLTLLISQYEISTGNVLIDGRAETDNFTITFDPQLASATLHVSNAIFEDESSFTFFNADIDLTWTATSDLTSQNFHDHFRVPGMVFNSHFRGTFRDATATGSILGKSVPNRGDLQFAPVPSSMGQLQSNQFGSIDVTIGSP